MRAALAEDLGQAGDITTMATIPAQARAQVRHRRTRSGVIAGLPLARTAFEALDAGIIFEANVADGARVDAGRVVARVEGPARGVLTAERVALNFSAAFRALRRSPRAFARRIAHTKARIVCDTRKTTPLMRAFEKYAVRSAAAPTTVTGSMTPF